MVTGKKRKLLSLVAGLGLGTLALIIFFFRLRGQGDEFRAAFSSVRYGPLLVSFVFIVLMHVLRAVRWKMLMSPFEVVSWGRVAHALLLGFFANNILPARAGELIRPYVVQTSGGIDFNQALASVVVDRLLDLTGIIILLFSIVIIICSQEEMALAFLGWLRVIQKGFYFMGAALSLLMMAMIALLFFPQKTGRLFQRLAEFLPKFLKIPFSRCVDSFVRSAEVISSLKAKFIIISLSVCVWLCQSLSTYYIAVGLDLNTGLIGAVLVTIVISFAIALPQAPGYLGIYHLAASLTIESFGTAAGQAGAFAILIWALNVIPITAIGLVVVVIKKGGIYNS